MQLHCHFDIHDSVTLAVADPGIWKGGGGGDCMKDIFGLATPTYKALGLLVVISR